MRSMVARLGAGAAITGLAVLVAGTFLPWLRSGSVVRDSYQSVGALRDLVSGVGGGLPSALMDAWLAVIPASVVSVALYALRLRRTSAVVGCLVSVTVGTAAALVLVQGSDAVTLIGAESTGPAVTLAGATIALIGAITVLGSPQGRQTVTTEGST
jgi:hypothetical protein